VVTVVGARPQFVKASVVSTSLAACGVREDIVHTGQHFDDNMSAIFFEELGIEPPAHHLGITAPRHGAMTGRMLEAVEQVLIDLRPDYVLVYGDTNSTLAGALAAAKLHIPIGHVEAGLRSFNREMPEEINRVVTDHVASQLFAPTDTAVANLRHEGIDEALIALTGDVMYDASLRFGERARASSTALSDAGVDDGQYVLATVHRAENTDDDRRLAATFDGLAMLATQIPVLVPVHPRTAQALARIDLLERVESSLKVLPPVGYLDMLRLEQSAALIATDSGGVQKEAFFYRVPCVTLRDETEWVELVELGWNRLLTPQSADHVRAGLSEALAAERPVTDAAPYGDGHSAGRIAAQIADAAPGVAR
jgi:UDP-GlcNAc3NAcA epimerase